MTSESALQKLTKALAAESTKALVAELSAGTAVTISGVGKLKPSDVADDGSFTIAFKPAKAKKAPTLA